VTVRRILHVDDSPQMQHSLELAVDGVDDLRVVATAPDGRRGVELARELHPDVVVLDQQMPELEGLDALPLIHEACPDALIVMWCNDPMIRDEAIERGADDVVDKAAPLTQLVTALRGPLHPRRPSPGS
jgi:DNA-binding NarL/FixJ family response regulator